MEIGEEQKDCCCCCITSEHEDVNPAPDGIRAPAVSAPLARPVLYIASINSQYIRICSVASCPPGL